MKDRLTPRALQNAPALIESVFPAQTVSFEAQIEWKAVSAQTLTGLGSYWKGRKPLVLVRAIVLGSLLPQTNDAEKDLEIFERLLAFDDAGLARRALIRNALKPKDIAARIALADPWRYLKARIRRTGRTEDELRGRRFPLDADAEGISLTWRRDLMKTTSSYCTARRWPPLGATRKRPPGANDPKRSIRTGSTGRPGPWSTATMPT